MACESGPKNIPVVHAVIILRVMNLSFLVTIRQVQKTSYARMQIF